VAAVERVSDSGRALRILLLSPFAPRHDAPHGGGRTIAQLTTHLGRRHDVALLCLRPNGDPPTDEQVRAACELVEEVELPGEGSNVIARWRRRLRLLHGFARGTPMWAVDCNVPAFSQLVTRTLESWEPDIVQAEFHVMGSYLNLVDSGSRVLTEHEPGVTAADETVRAAHGPARSLARADAAAWRRFESCVLGDADALVVYSERDRRVLEQLATGVPFVRVPLGIDIPETPASSAGDESPTVLFVGNFIHPPNVDAALRLATSIFPSVAQEIPDARLYLVGDRPPRELERAADSNVVVTGRVDDVVPYLERANAVVAPLRRGGGTRVKVLEALAYGKALVASSLALEGIDVTDGVHVLVADADDASAAALVSLLRDRTLRERLGGSARRWAEENLGWRQTIAGYDRLYEDLLQRRDAGVRR
jgi:glycosyltransferase involved in cell wall biosynthesis